MIKFPNFLIFICVFSQVKNQKNYTDLTNLPIQDFLSTTNQKILDLNYSSKIDTSIGPPVQIFTTTEAINFNITSSNNQSNYIKIFPYLLEIIYKK